MSYVPTPTYAQLKDDTVSIPGLSGPTQMTADPDPVFSQRLVQAAAIAVLLPASLPVSASSSFHLRLDGTVWAQLLQVSAAVVTA